MAKPKLTQLERVWLEVQDEIDAETRHPQYQEDFSDSDMEDDELFRGVFDHGDQR